MKLVLIILAMIGLIAHNTNGSGIIEFDLLDREGKVIESYAIDTVWSHVIDGQDIHRAKDILIRSAPEGFKMNITLAGNEEDIVITTLAEITPSSYPQGVYLFGDTPEAVSTNKPAPFESEWIKLQFEILPFFISHETAL
ncbi:hypothetical protein MDAP_000353 [Mitosporidium daphniae]